MTDILLVHGAWHGPWCWDGAAARLRGQGHQVEVVALRGHDRPRRRIWHRVHHYVEDVADAAARCELRPVIVGHSIGALVVLKYLERRDAAAAVLLAPIPSSSSLAAVFRLATRHPIAFGKACILLRLRPLTATRTLVRDLFFTPQTPDHIVDHCHARLQDESFPAFLDTILVRPRPRRVRTPVIVLAAGQDAIFTVDEMRRTAHVYGRPAEIFDGIGHDMMLDVGWQRVTDRIAEWAMAGGFG